MKRWVLGSILFPITVALGLSILFLVTSDDAARYCPVVVPSTALSEYPVNETEEFRGLPSPDEVLFPESTDSLIDVLGHAGVYRESEIIAKSGQYWLGLFEENGKARLVSSRVGVKRLQTKSYPGDDHDVRLQFDRLGLPFIAVRNIKNLKAGPVTTIYQRPSRTKLSAEICQSGGWKLDINTTLT